jgi:GT2 family glycosyltransferase
VTTDGTPELSVVCCTLADADEIEGLSVLAADEFDDYEVVIRRDDGICAARNAGIREARADRIVFLDDDAVPESGYLAAASAALDEAPVVAGRIHQPVPEDHVLADFAPHYDQGDERAPATSITGCNMAFRREALEAVGGFDERLEWGHDETDLFRRLRAAGFDALYEPEMAVTHAYATSVRDYWRKMYRFGPADVYFETKYGVPLWRQLFELLIPFRLTWPPRAAAIEAVGTFLRNVSKARAFPENYRAGRRAREEVPDSLRSLAVPTGE